MSIFKGWFPDKEELPASKVWPPCEHKRVEVRGSNIIGWCTCLTCGREINMAEWLTKTMKHMVDLIEELEKKR